MDVHGVNCDWLKEHTEVCSRKPGKFHNFDSTKNQETRIRAFNNTRNKKIFGIKLIEIRRHTKKLWPNEFWNSFGTKTIESHETWGPELVQTS